MPGPFDGIKVLDLSQVVSGPLATMLLSDQGAEVLKVEPAKGASDTVRMGTFMKAGISALYVNNNRGKRSISLDLRKDEGRDIALELAAKCDVFVQNFRPGAVDRLSLGYEDIRKINPNVIYVSISGFGPSGPYSDRGVYDPIIQGLSGIVVRQTNPEIPIPDLVRNLVADKTTALTVAQAISAALFHRERTGEGQHIEVPMIDAFLYFFWPDGMMDRTMLDEDVSPGFLLSNIYRLTPTADGRVIYFMATDAQRHGLCIALGHPEWNEHPDFESLAAITRPDNIEKSGAAIANAFLSLTSKEALDRMLENDVPCGEIVGPENVHVDPQIVHNAVLETWEHPTAGKIRQPRPAARFSATPASMGRSAVVVGENNDEVLEELGRTPKEIEALRESGAVGSLGSS
jgi:crotonobetainyl-CoA:carnitine CoA-transferase CaiB-like acyl-CoA transferase